MREGVRKLQGYDVEKFSSNTINPQPDISEEQVSRIEDLLGLLDPTQTLPV
jgi:hypothetical protein